MAMILSSSTAGLAFPEDDMLGIDLVIPDVTYLTKNIDKIKGIVLTHGHEDHIGALPYILKQINVPVFGTLLTLGLLENKLREHKMLDSTTRHTVVPGEKVKLGQMVVEFIHTNHSIADAVALATIHLWALWCIRATLRWTIRPLTVM